MTTSTLTPAATSPAAGRRVEQARYRTPDGERGLYAQRIHGRVALVDVPIDHHGRVLLVERHVESLAELQGIVAAYVEHSTRPACPPSWPAAVSWIRSPTGSTATPDPRRGRALAR